MRLTFLSAIFAAVLTFSAVPHTANAAPRAPVSGPALAEATSRIEDGKIDVNGVRYHYLLAKGRGTPVVLLHGGAAMVVIPDGLGGYLRNGEIHLIDGRGVVLGLYDDRSFDEALSAARQAVR